MNTGTYISGIGHAVLILWLLFGGWMTRDLSELPQAADVSLISAEEFAMLSAPQAAQPEAEISPPAPEPPAADAAPEPPAQTEDAPLTSEVPEPEAPAEPDVVPDQPDPLAPVEQPVNDEVAALVPPEAEVAVPDLPPSERPPQPQSAPRVAPLAVPEAPNDPQISDTASPPVSPDAPTDRRAEEEDEAAPEEATIEIVTEAEQPSGGAPQASLRPQARPPRPQPPAAPAAEPPADAIADAVAAAVADTPPDSPAAASQPSDLPVGPPLTGGEKDALRVAVQQCWNVGSLSTDALATTVVVAVAMLQDGRPDAGSIRLLESRDGSAEAARQAFEAARRAIIRCGANGYDLPPEKYGQWRDIEITFNPENMRIK